MSKYHSRKIKNRYGEFDSKAEFERYLILLDMQKCGEISELTWQVVYVLIPPQKCITRPNERACKYLADFRYIKDGKTIVEDVKGIRTKDYIIKRKLMLYIHGIEIVEVKA